ncbi:hypothetical protein YC2023_076613 [Brassica napus]
MLDKSMSFSHILRDLEPNMSDQIKARCTDCMTNESDYPTLKGESYKLVKIKRMIREIEWYQPSLSWEDPQIKIEVHDLIDLPVRGMIHDNKGHGTPSRKDAEQKGEEANDAVKFGDTNVCKKRGWMSERLKESVLKTISQYYYSLSRQHLQQAFPLLHVKVLGRWFFLILLMIMIGPVRFVNWTRHPDADADRCSFGAK